MTGLAVFGMLAMLASDVRTPAAAEPPGRIERIERKADAAATKVLVMLSRPLAFQVRVLDADPTRKHGRRLVLDFENTTLAPEATTPLELNDGFVRQIRTGQFTASTARLVLDLAGDTTHSVEAYETPPHVTIAIVGPPAADAPAARSNPSKPITP